MVPFQPLWRNPHMQTVLAHFWPRPDVSRDHPIERRFVQTEPGVRVLVMTQRPKTQTRGDVVMVHGLEGSGEAGYIRSLSAAAVMAGFTAHRFHMRTCGGTEHLCETLYHAGLTSDLLAVLYQLREGGASPAAIVGFSLGGNVVLKLAGELGEKASDLIRCVTAASTPLDLAACSRRISEPDNRIYQERFVRKMRDRLCATGRYRMEDFESLRTVEDLDDRVTAPSFGFGNAANYYRSQSCLGYLAAIRVPTLLIQSKDDTFIPFSIYDVPEVRQNPSIRLLATDHGGHLGFIGRAPHRLWLDETIMEFIGNIFAKNPSFESSQV